MSPRERVQALIAAAADVARPDTPLGVKARAAWVSTTGLSPEGIELAIEHCLETHPSEAEIEQLLASVQPAKRALVLLSANVFVGASRALALALASSEHVMVRVSRRDPVLARVLLEACPGLFELTDELAPKAEDVFWAYGKKETLRTVRAKLPAGVHFIGHGPGAGAALVELPEASPEVLIAQAKNLVLDTVLFEQRGCLSPRAFLVTGSKGAAEEFTQCVVSELTRMGGEVPRGELAREEEAELVRFRDTMAYVGRVMDTKAGLVAFSESTSLSSITPVGRAIHIQHLADPILPLARIGHVLTNIGFFGSDVTKAELLRALPHVRIAPLGQMQSPPFDGPVDRRPHL
ncbi:MAG: acyl-CoA reductase [Polyangiaceae bacterium]|nr:acyl-CoA reductase [Polyangiaceae bacterium]